VVIGGGLAGAGKLFMRQCQGNERRPQDPGRKPGSPDGRRKHLTLKTSGNAPCFSRARPTGQGPGTDKTVAYDPLKRIGIGLSRLAQAGIAVAHTPLR